MVEKYSSSGPNNLTYTFILLVGLMFHDGAPVTSADVIQSIKRWGGMASLGQMLMNFTKEMKAVDDKTFQLILNEPFSLVLVALGMPIFDNLDLEAVAEQAQQQGRTEFLFTTAPLRVTGGTGSPLNPIATF